MLIASPTQVDPSRPVQERILVVDDERLNREMLAQLLCRSGYVPEVASSGIEAIEIVAAGGIHMVLLDIVMPRMDGFAVLTEFRKRWSAIELPVIMVTADTDTTQVVKALRQGANDFVHKPIDPDVTIARINTLMNVRQLQSALIVSEERYSLASQGANDGLWDWDLTTGHVYFSPRWRRMLGIGDDQSIQTIDAWLSRTHPEDQSRVRAELDKHLRGEVLHFETELRMLHEDGIYRWMLCRGLAVRDGIGNATRIAGSLTDITEGKVADALTGLPNRLLFRERLQRTLDKAKEGGRSFAVLYFDLDNFKLVNDSLGHAAGDEMLVGVAKRLERCVRANESIVARIGGDEFAILLENTDSLDHAKMIASRVTEAIAAPFSLGNNREVFSSASIGITYVADGFGNADDLLREADTAMYEAKQRGKNQFQIFSPSMHEEANQRLDLESELRRAVERDEIFLLYQPIVNLQTTRVVGFEALARWSHPRLGLVSPLKFIPIAEETGLIVSIGAKILTMACQQMCVWQRDFPHTENLTLNVNLSAKQLSKPTIVREIQNTLLQTGIKPECLRIELTESAIMENLHEGVELLAALRESGMRIEIDDFGTGYSSLQLLHKLPLDVLKVDRGFVSGMARSTESMALVRTVLTLAESLGLDVIAEGIETEEQRVQLMSMGCRLGQGFLFAKPLDVAAVEALLHKYAEDDLSVELAQTTRLVPSDCRI